MQITPEVMKRSYLMHLLLFVSLLCTASWCDPDPDDENDDITEDPVHDPTGRISKDSIIINWSTGADIPIEVGWSAVSVLNNKFYVIGGANQDLGTTDLVQVYDPVSDSWSQAANKLLSRRWGHSSNMIDGTIYVMGGLATGRGDGNDTIEVYASGSDGWVEKGLMTPGRIGHRTCEFNEKIYVSGGEYEEPSLSVLDLVDVYDPSTETWESLTPMPTPRIFHGICVVEDTIYVMGGGKDYPYSGIVSIEAYDPVENTWKQRANLKHGLADFSVCVIDNKIFCMGGYFLWGTPGVAKVQVYDPVVDSVYMATDIQYPSYASTAVAYDNKIYLISGCNSTPSSGFESFSPKLEIGVPEF